VEDAPQSHSVFESNRGVSVDEARSRSAARVKPECPDRRDCPAAGE
jgi:hypothetical protein